LQRYVRAFVAFFAAMVLIAALTAVAMSTRPPVADPDVASRAATFAPVTSSLES
jgi:hypothetical protein